MVYVLGVASANAAVHNHAAPKQKVKHTAPRTLPKLQWTEKNRLGQTVRYTATGRISGHAQYRFTKRGITWSATSSTPKRGRLRTCQKQSFRLTLSAVVVDGGAKAKASETDVYSSSNCKTDKAERVATTDRWLCHLTYKRIVTGSKGVFRGSLRRRLNLELIPNRARTVERIVERPGQESRASAQCDFMAAGNSLTSNLTVDTVVFYTADGATLTNVEYNWGDGRIENIAADRASHTYAAPGTYIITAKLTFTKADGSTITSNCASITITPKNGTTGQGTGTPGPGGGSGSGGTPERRSDTTGEACRLPDGSVGFRDQFGICNPTT